jgi:hypothetical protein
MTDHPLYDTTSAALSDDPLADRPEGVALHDAAVPLPTLAAPDDEPEACHGCGDTPHHLSTDGYCDGCAIDPNGAATGGPYDVPDWPPPKPAAS